MLFARVAAASEVRCLAALFAGSSGVLAALAIFRGAPEDHLDPPLKAFREIYSSVSKSIEHERQRRRRRRRRRGRRLERRVSDEDQRAIQRLHRCKFCAIASGGTNAKWRRRLGQRGGITSKLEKEGQKRSWMDDFCNHSFRLSLFSRSSLLLTFPLQALKDDAQWDTTSALSKD
jgi:hypothetical protein